MRAYSDGTERCQHCGDTRKHHKANGKCKWSPRWLATHGATTYTPWREAERDALAARVVSSMEWTPTGQLVETVFLR